MTLSTIGFRYLGQIHSPFSGLPAELNDEGANQADPTLLFVYYGMAGEWDYVCARFPSNLTRFVDNLEPADLAQSLEVDGAIMLAVDTDWNGINYYGFAPENSEIRFTADADLAE